MHAFETVGKSESERNKKERIAPRAPFIHGTPRNGEGNPDASVQASRVSDIPWRYPRKLQTT